MANLVTHCDVPDATDVGTIRSQAEDSMIFAAANLDVETRRKIGSQPKEFIRFCSFNQRDCFPSLEWPSKQCVVDGRTDSYIYAGYNYTTEGCFRSCFQSLIIKECQCADPKFPAPRGIQHCRFNVSSERICVNKVNEILGGVHGDFAEKQCPDCIQSCKQKVFDVTFSTAKWPHPASMGAYYKLCEGQVSKDDCKQYLVDNALALEIYYEQLNYERLRESAAYPMANLLADLGGQLGLWLGFSVITICEFIFLFLNMCRLYVKVRRERRHMRMLMSLSDKSNCGSLAADGKFNNSTVTMTLNMSRVDIPSDVLSSIGAPRNSLRDARGRRYTLRVVSTSVENCDQNPDDSDSNPEVDRRRRERPPTKDDEDGAWRDRAQSQPRNSGHGAGHSLRPAASVSFSDQVKKDVNNDDRGSSSSSSMDSQATAKHRTLNTAARKHLAVKDHRASVPY
uniref:Uncharacterized protein n=1 Tax=Romanomermis culicivorax TaxID=13658 RepID=A0A915IV29_ROMCU